MSCAMLCLVAQLCPTLCNPMDCSTPGSSVHADSPGKNTGVGCHALLQEIFPTHGSSPGLLYCRQILYQLSHQGSPSACLTKLKSWVPFKHDAMREHDTWAGLRPQKSKPLPGHPRVRGQTQTVISSKTFQRSLTLTSLQTAAPPTPSFPTLVHCLLLLAGPS